MAAQLDDISPDTVDLNDRFTMTLTGSRFDQNCEVVVTVNGTEVKPRRIDSTESSERMEAEIDEKITRYPGSHPVIVRDAAGGNSNALPLTVQ
ncbi:MAG: IPT/TIG domain-containing protein [Rhizobiales bacterium]|nr:IPT/TIG domain-containing protein [Hyphomicrobiales bacterium]